MTTLHTTANFDVSPLGIEDKLTKLQERLSTKTNELTFLRKYKVCSSGLIVFISQNCLSDQDKVFPVRARRIAELRHQIDALNVSNEVLLPALLLSA